MTRIDRLDLMLLYLFAGDGAMGSANWIADIADAHGQYMIGALVRLAGILGMAYLTVRAINELVLWWRNEKWQ